MTDSKEEPGLTELQKVEREALTGDRMAIVQVVSALRQYRAACKKLLGGRYRDGFVDGPATLNLECTIEEIEGLHRGSADEAEG